MDPAILCRKKVYALLPFPPQGVFNLIVLSRRSLCP
jgi:hypothetical protein